jgi:hypothetical protein
MIGLIHRFYATLANEKSHWIDSESRRLDHAFQTVMMLIYLCQRKCPAAHDLLLPDGDETVCRHLLHCLQQKHPSEDRTWVEKHAKTYRLLQLSWGVKSPDPRTRESRWLPTLSALHQSALVFAQHKHVCSTPVAERSGTASGQVSKFMMDIHPSMGKERVSSQYGEVGQISPCILPTQMMWLHFEDQEPRQMLGKESMLFQGWPIESVDLPDWADNKFLQDLAGNGVSLPVMLALVMGTLSALTFARENSAPDLDSAEDPNVDETLKLLASMIGDPSDLMEVHVSTAAATASETTSVNRANLMETEAALNEDRPETPAVGGGRKRKVVRLSVRRLIICYMHGVLTFLIFTMVGIDS